MSTRLQYVVVTCSTCLLVVLLLGTVLTGTSAADENAYRHFAVFTDVMSKIKSEYVEEPDMKSVALGALTGLLESIDPFASYLSVDQYKQYLQSKQRRQAHVGLVLARRFGYVGVVDAIPGSPADKLGITTGDILEAINGVSTRDMPLAYADILMNGDRGTTLEMSLIRVRRSAEAQKVAVIREVIPYPPVTVRMLPDGVGLLRVTSMETGKTAELARNAVDLERLGATRLVLDLRNNSWGSTEEGIAAANLFLAQGLITYLQGQKTARQDFQADPAKATTKLPLVVLTNRGTAGGAEVLAAALLDNKRAEVVGERTFGDASQRKALTLDDGSAVILAVAKYHAASGKAIQDTGVVPSLIVFDAEPTPDSDDDTTQPPATPPARVDEDLQLKKAIEVLTSGLAAAKQSGATRVAQRPAPKGPGVDDSPLVTQPLNPRPPR